MKTGAGKDVQDVASVITAIENEAVIKNEDMIIKSVYLTSTNYLEAIAFKTWTRKDGSPGQEWVIGHGFNAKRDENGQLQVWWSNGSYGWESEKDAEAHLFKKDRKLKSAMDDIVEAMDAIGWDNPDEASKSLERAMDAVRAAVAADAIVCRVWREGEE